MPAPMTACFRLASSCAPSSSAQGFQIACLEEIAYRLGYIDDQALRALAEPLLKTDYGRYLLQVLDEQGPRDWAELS